MVEKNGNNEFHPPKWSRLKEFKRIIEHGKFSEMITVVVAISDHDPFYRYSVKVGVLRTRRKESDENDLYPFVNPFVTNQRFGKANVDDTLKITAQLFLEADEWIRNDAQSVAESYVEGQTAIQQEFQHPKLEQEQLSI